MRIGSEPELDTYTGIVLDFQVGLGEARRGGNIELPEEVQRRFETLSGDIPEIEGFVAEEKARLALMLPQNRNVEEEFATREALIRRIEKQLEDSTTKVTALNARWATVALWRWWRFLPSDATFTESVASRTISVQNYRNRAALEVRAGRAHSPRR